MTLSCAALLRGLDRRGSGTAAAPGPCASSGSTSSPRASGPARMFAAATASWIARLMPMPPIGDMAWAASPIASRPGRYQRVSRSSLTRQQMQVADIVELGRGRARPGAAARPPRGSPRSRAPDIPRPRPWGSGRRTANNRRGRSSRAAARARHCRAARRSLLVGLASRNQKTSIGAPRSSSGSSCRGRSTRGRRRRWSAGARSSRAVGEPDAGDPAAAPRRSRRPAPPSRSVKAGKRLRLVARGNRGSPIAASCAMNGAGVSRCDRSPIVHSRPAMRSSARVDPVVRALEEALEHARAGRGSPSSRGGPCRRGNRGRSRRASRAPGPCSRRGRTAARPSSRPGPPPTMIRSQS